MLHGVRHISMVGFTFEAKSDRVCLCQQHIYSFLGREPRSVLRYLYSFEDEEIMHPRAEDTTPLFQINVYDAAHKYQIPALAQE